MDAATGTEKAGKSKEFEIGEARRRRVPKGRPEERRETQGKIGKDEGKGKRLFPRRRCQIGYRRLFDEEEDKSQWWDVET